MPWVWGTLTLEGARVLRPVPPRLAARLLPRGHGAEGGRRRRRGDRLLDYLWRVQKPDGSWWQNTRVDGTRVLDQPAARRGRAAGRPRLVARAARRRTTGEHVQRGGRLHRRQRARRPSRSAGRTRSGWSPNTIATEIAAPDLRRRRSRGRTATRRARRRTRRPRTTWQAQVEGWTATTNGPTPTTRTTSASRRTANPDDGSTYSLGDNFPRPGGRARDRRQLVPRARAVRRQARGTTRSCATRSRSATSSSRRTRRAGGSGTASRSTATARRADGGDWDIFPTAARQTLGRVWPLLAGERGEYELLAGGDARPHLRHDRQHRQRRADAARAGLGRPARRRPSPPARARARPRRWRGRTRSSSASRGRSTRASRSSGRRSSPAATARTADRGSYALASDARSRR